MTLELNQPYIAQRVANKDGKLHFLPGDGFCGDVVLNTPYHAKRVGNKDGKLHFLLSDQQMESGQLMLDKPYLAKRVANKDGSLHYLIGGKKSCCYCDDKTDPIHMKILTSVGTFEFNAGYYANLTLSPFVPTISDWMLTNDRGNEPGWVGSNMFSPPATCESIGEPDWGFHFIVWVCRCDMRIFVRQISGRGGVIHATEYTDCNDPGDTIVCSPFSVIRKMEFNTPIYTQIGHAPHPLETCSGYAAGCSGAEYVQLSPI